jgi:hypothetical protein
VQPAVLRTVTDKQQMALTLVNQHFSECSAAVPAMRAEILNSKVIRTRSFTPGSKCRTWEVGCGTCHRWFTWCRFCYDAFLA